MTIPVKIKSAPALLAFLSGFIIPRTCPLCSGQLQSDRDMCSSCLSEIADFTNQTCSKCGNILGFSYSLEEAANYVCGQCIKKPPPFTKSVSASPYEGRMKQLVRKFKYDGKEYLGREISEIIFNRCSKVIQKNNFDVITSIPLHTNALRKRGFDQSFVLAERLGNILGLEGATETMLRIYGTQSQTHLSRKERIDNVRGSFRLLDNAKISISDKNVLLLDDVCTTGETIRECARVLKKGGSKEIFVLTAARA